MTVGVILAAGLGSRLRPLTDDRPKCLMSLGDETILGRAVRQLAALGVRQLVVATGYEAARVREALRDAPMAVSFAHCADYASTQNSVSLLRALEAAPPGDFIKLDGDLVLPSALLAMALEGERSTVLLDDRAPPREEAMKALCEGDRALRFGKGLDPARCRGESLGVERFVAADRDGVLAALREAEAAGETGLYYEEVYDRAIAGGVALYARSIGDARWTEVDDHDDLGRARALVAGGL
ncbi:MAG: phosphocholine cytidylyltransferase family protein [Polyangiales bacterium]